MRDPKLAHILVVKRSILDLAAFNFKPMKLKIGTQFAIIYIEYMQNEQLIVRYQRTFICCQCCCMCAGLFSVVTVFDAVSAA